MPLEKVPTGIAGFDDIARGGLPRGRTTLITGTAGSGKTVFALQSLVHALRDLNEKAIFVAFEEKAQQILDNAASFGWDLEHYIANNQLTLLDARISPNTVHAGGFDAINVLLALLNDRIAERQELYRIRDWLSDHRVTGVITARGGDEGLTYTQEAFMSFMADCLLQLTHRTDGRVAVRELRIVKYRGSSFGENTLPFVIGPQGVQIARFGPMDLDFDVSTERVTTGVARLDHMLQGGYYRGTATLITGSPGTAKTTLSGAFTQATCERGERALYVSFDEAASEIIRNLKSVGIDLQRHVDSGLLTIYSSRTEARSAEEHLLNIFRLLDSHQPACLVLDPLSAIIKAGGTLNAYSVAQRLLYETKARKITVMFTSLLEGSNPEEEATPLQISTIADTWIHLSYTVQAGERNRLLTIIKSRGTAHSAQVRELILTRDGVTLADVYAEGGAVLVGTLRRERELEADFALQRQRADEIRRHAEVQARIAEASANMEALQHELTLRRAELEVLETERLTAEAHREQFRAMQKELRGSEGNTRQPPDENPPHVDEEPCA